MVQNPLFQLLKEMQEDRHVCRNLLLGVSVCIGLPFGNRFFFFKFLEHARRIRGYWYGQKDTGWPACLIKN